MDLAEARRRVEGAPVARLATRHPTGRIDLVPVTFALLPGEAPDRFGTLVSPVDHKPKLHLRLQRLADVATEPAVALLVDHYEQDWEALWWVRLWGTATVEESVDPVARAGTALAGRYPQYREHPPLGPALVVAVDRWQAWSWAGGVTIDGP
jgi:PPOX class probable F420-dependent enzyme